MQITKGDRVRVLRGDDAGKEGQILRVLPKVNRVVIEGVNVVKRHRKPTRADEEGGIIRFPAAIHASNVMLLDPKSKAPTRVRRKKNQDGSVERLAVKSGQPVPRNR
ncbi:MAG: 50S ribosomal protein L24 [Gemmatimonadota bacterium]|nr:50S ribosomal protein L24 [Gemmatimonadota bacterium]MDH5195800.1 50S ribosomal protein L24 [Gemmatimonadota bacterium]